MNKAIKKIELDLGGKVVSLTPEQAKNLKEALDELFGKEVIREYFPAKEYIPVPYPTPYRPLVPYFERPYYWEWPHYGDRITCEGKEFVGSLTASCTDSGTLRLTG